MALNKFYNLKVNSGVPLSRFVVDLKKNLEAQEAKPVEIKKTKNIEEKLENLAEADYGKYFSAGKEKGKALARTLIDKTKKLNGLSFRIPAIITIRKENKVRKGKIKKNKTAVTSGGRLDQLAFVGLGK